MLLEMETWIKWPSTPNDRVIYFSVIDTNIFVTQTASVGLLTEYVYPLGILVALAMSASAVIVFRRRKQPEARTRMLEQKVMDLTYNLSGINRGECYLADSFQHCLKVVSDLHSRGVSILCIVREDPESITKNYNLKPDDVVLLSSKPIKGFKAVDGLQDIAITIVKFLRAGGGAVLLDGLEYLISRFGFNSVYKMCQENHIEFLDAGAVLLVPINMEALDSREKGQLLSELKLL
jgi:hypothetical protein